MNKKTAFITGINGQDGRNLSQVLIEKGYNVVGIIRRNSIPENQESRIDEFVNKGLVDTIYGDLLDIPSLEHALKLWKPDFIYNLAAQSHVRISFDIPSFTVQTNALGTLNLLEAYRNICPNARFYMAASSEMFGNSCDDDKFQRLTTPMKPVSPYGCSKLFAYNICRAYRESYSLHICNGILFNHESKYRGSNFVTSKVVKTAIEIKKGIQNKLILGNLDSYRDWGHSLDYMKAISMIMDYGKARDWVVSTGATYSVRELCQYVFRKLDMDYKDYVIQDKKYMRPNELNYLRGDSSEIRNILGWKPTYTFETLLDEMIDFWRKHYKL